jgi:DNA-binding protein HU-beta
MHKLRNLNHTALIETVAHESGVSREDVDRVLRAMFDVIARNVMAGFKVTVTNFGTWHSHILPPRVHRNPMTGETFQKGAARYPRFLYSPKIKDATVKGEILETVKKRGH